MNQEKEHKEKIYFWQKIHEKNLKNTFLSALIGLVILTFLIIVIFFSIKNLTDNIAFIITGIIALYFGFFTISAYWVARKVEEYVRMPIRNYEDFIRQANFVLKKGRGEFRVMSYFPYFALDKKVREAGGAEVNESLLQLSEEPSKPLKILTLNEEEQDKFLNQMKDKLNVDEVIIEEAKARYKTLQKNLGKEKFKLYPGLRLPIQMFWSSTIVTFVAIDEPPEYPTPELKCSGFTSRDPDIKEAFRLIFSNYF